MLKTKLSNKKIIKSWQGITAVLTAGVIAGGLMLAPVALADTYDDQIRALNQQNAATQAGLNQLGAEASSLAETIAKLQNEINALQGQIATNEQKRTETIQQIEIAEAELAKQKKLLGENIKAMYLEGQISTLEMLASSKDLSEFVDKEQYRNTVKSKIKESVDRINELKAQLDEQKLTLDRLIADLNAMQARVAAQQAEQNRLLSLNQAQQSELDGQIKANSAKISELRKQQAIENAKRFGSTPGVGAACGGGYPGSARSQWGTWGCNWPLDNTIDNWGMYNRECVSYTAFRVANSGRNMPYWGGYGNANQWDDNARRMGIPVDGNPRVGDVAVSNAGYYGHVMYVEAVYGDGTIYVSQYNFSYTGTYSEMRIGTGGLVFIHF